MKDRIQQFLQAENKSSSKFAGEIGVQPSGVSHVLSGRNKPSLDFILKMLDTYSSINADWLLFGKGEMYKKDEKPVLHGQKGTGTTPQNEIIYNEGNLFKGFDREFDSENAEKGDEKLKTGEFAAARNHNSQEDSRSRDDNELGGIKTVDGQRDKDNAVSDRIIIFYSDGTYREYNPRR